MSDSMLLVGQRSFFQLDLLDYQYPTANSSTVDLNRLWVAVRSGWWHHRSTAKAAVLYTYEIEQLLTWLRHLYQGGYSSERLLFADPSLSIECISVDADEFLLQVKLAFAVAPDWHTNPFFPFWLPVVVSKAKIGEAITDLEGQFARFPVRH
ncbi:hypothetical protein WBJ53_26320 [Spirosoma sp. SC4-14]|uniref:WapI family immunity protein n=1 Tax=Spirosoma sp. SC4-14 TaxID=3128900 RepID=UPI0030CE6A67